MKINHIAFLIILLTSCAVNRNSYDLHYKGETNYKSFYVVDTIKIENPIIVNDHGKRVVCSKVLVKDIGIDEAFFKRPDVFMLGEDLYYDLNSKDYKKYHYPDYGNCEEIKLDTLINKQITIYWYTTDSVRFILCLINSNYYNIKHRTIDSEYFRIMNNDQKNSYYKIVYPICN